MSASLATLDIVDLGLTHHFLANDAGSAAAQLANPNCLISLSCDAQHIAFALGERLLIQRQLVPTTGKPRLVHMPAGDQVLSICWLSLSTAPPAVGASAAQKAQAPHRASGACEHVPVLLVGSSSGRLGAYSHLGTALWSACPHDAPLLQIVPHTGGRSRDLLCLHEGGVLAHAEGEALHHTLIVAAHEAAGHGDGSLDDLGRGIAHAVARTVSSHGAGVHGAGAHEPLGRSNELFCSIWLAQVIEAAALCDRGCNPM